jgi:hypothetical protein
MIVDPKMPFGGFGTGLGAKAASKDSSRTELKTVYFA